MPKPKPLKKKAMPKAKPVRRAVSKADAEAIARKIAFNPYGGRVQPENAFSIIFDRYDRQTAVMVSDAYIKDYCEEWALKKDQSRGQRYLSEYFKFEGRLLDARHQIMSQMYA